MVRRTRPRTSLRCERGFTLVELLVAMALGIVVVSAVITTLNVTMAEATRTFTMIDATQRARPTLAKLQSELASACLTSGITPIEAGSTANSLIFLSAFGNAAQPTPIEHDITFSSSSGNLTDAVYAVTGGSAPDWTFSSTPYATTTLLTAVSQSGTTPVFQYFAYQQAPNGSGGYYTDGAGNPYMMLLDGTSSVPGTSPAVIPAASPLSDALPSGLSAVNAQAAAEVMITMRIGASGGPDENTTISGASLNVTDSIVLRLTPPPNNAESGATFGPCE
jgi:prepilin-type N-terminal cleavage/methylation domain-containing protein